MEQVEEGIKGRKKNYEEITKRIFVISFNPIRQESQKSHENFWIDPRPISID